MAAERKDKTNKRKYNMWSIGETNKFLQGLSLFQRNFIKIAEYITTKDYSQTRDYFYRLLKGIRASIGSPFDKELASSNIQEITYLMEVYCEHKQKSAKSDSLGSVLRDAIISYRRHGSPVPHNSNTPLRNPPVQSSTPSQGTKNAAQQDQSALFHGEIKLDTPSPPVIPYSPTKHFPDKYTLKLFPGSESLDRLINSKGLRPHLALSVSKAKKVSSILAYLEQKWAIPLDGNQLRLLPKGNQSHYGWGSETTNNIHVVDIATELSRLYEEDIELEYLIDSFSSHYCQEVPVSDDLSIDLALGSIHQKYETFESTDDHNELGAYQEDPEEYESLLDLVNREDVPRYIHAETNTPNLFDDSRDGFDMMKETKKYEGKCREFWYNREASVDYTTMFKKSGTTSAPAPSPKKRKISSSPTK